MDDIEITEVDEVIDTSLITHVYVVYSESGTLSFRMASLTTLAAALTRSSINSKTDNYTLALTDQGKLVELSHASGKAITVPPNSSVAFPVGTTIRISQMGAGTVTISAGSGVTIRSRTGLVMAGQYAVATLIKRATNEWMLFGDTTT